MLREYKIMKSIIGWFSRSEAKSKEKFNRTIHFFTESNQKKKTVTYRFDDDFDPSALNQSIDQDAHIQKIIQNLEQALQLVNNADADNPYVDNKEFLNEVIEALKYKTHESKMISKNLIDRWNKWDRIDQRVEEQQDENMERLIDELITNYKHRKKFTREKIYIDIIADLIYCIISDSWNLLVNIVEFPHKNKYSFRVIF